MRTIATYILLGVLLYSSVGFIINFEVILAEWHHEVRVLLSKIHHDDTHIVRLTFHKSQFDSTEKEFIKDGFFYDVIEVEQMGDSLALVCFKDVEETHLVGTYSAIATEGTAKSGRLARRMKIVVKHLSAKYLPCSSPTFGQIAPAVLDSMSKVIPYRSPFLPHPFASINPPPPRC